MLFFVLIVFLVLIIIGIQGWNNLIVPNIARVSKLSFPLLLGFSLLAGVVSFFSPCAFALLPGYAAFYLGSENNKKRQPAKIGITASLGVVSFFILLSIIFILVGQAITQYLAFIGPLIGFILLILGLIMFIGYSFKLNIIQNFVDGVKTKESKTKRNMYLFGFGYGGTSLGCTLPLIFALIITPLTTGKIFNLLFSLLIYALGMSILMIFVTYLVAWSKNRIINKMISSTVTIKKISGLILIIIGAYLIYYNIFYSMLL